MILAQTAGIAATQADLLDSACTKWARKNRNVFGGLSCESQVILKDGPEQALNFLSARLCLAF